MVGHHINLAIVDTYWSKRVLAVVGDFHIVWIQALEILHIERIAFTGTLEDEDVALFLIDTHLVEEQRVAIAAEL